METKFTTTYSAEELRQKNALFEQNKMIDAKSTAVLFSDGSVDALAFNETTKKKIGFFSDVVSIAASNYAVFGLCKDGTVFDSQLVDGYFFWKDKASVCVPSWRDIIAVSGGGRNGVSVAGLRKDGTVVIYDNDKIILDPNIWKNIVQISFGGGHLVGLKSDGTVVAAGDNDHGQCNVSDWNDIVHVSAGSTHTVGVKADGTVIAVGENDAGQCDVFGWTNVERVSAGVRHTVGLGRDGNVVATAYRGPSDVYGGQCEVSHWSELDVIDISAGAVQTIGIRRDGKLISTVNKLKGDFARDDQFSRLFRIVGCQLFDDYDSLASERETKFVVRTKKREMYESKLNEKSGVAKQTVATSVSSGADKYVVEDDEQIICEAGFENKSNYDKEREAILAELDKYSHKSMISTVVLCLLFGHVGFHRLFNGKIWTGLLYMFTLGLCGVGWLYDFIKIIAGKFTDRDGRYINDSKVIKLNMQLAQLDNKYADE